jgi:hypothetical protein
MSAALVIYRGLTCTCDVPPVDLRRMSVLVPCHGCLALRSGEELAEPKLMSWQPAIRVPGQ